MSPKLQQYLIELGAALALYLVLSVISFYLLRTQHLQNALAYAAALLPMIGAIASAWAILRHVRRLDELQRRRELEGLTFAGVVTAFVTLGWGFAEVAGAPALPTFAIMPLMTLFWLVGDFIACRSYR